VEVESFDGVERQVAHRCSIHRDAVSPAQALTCIGPPSCGSLRSARARRDSGYGRHGL